MLEKELRERMTTLSFLNLVENDNSHMNDFHNTFDSDIKPELVDMLVRKYQPFFSRRLNKIISENETRAILKECLQHSCLNVF